MKWQLQFIILSLTILLPQGVLAALIDYNPNHETGVYHRIKETVSIFLGDAYKNETSDVEKLFDTFQKEYPMNHAPLSRKIEILLKELDATSNLDRERFEIILVYIVNELERLSKKPDVSPRRLGQLLIYLHQAQRIALKWEAPRAVWKIEAFRNRIVQPKNRCRTLLMKLNKIRVGDRDLTPLSSLG